MNLPNKLSIFRILLVPVAALLLLLPDGYLASDIQYMTMFGYQINILYIISLVIFAIASITDFIDGYLARKHNIITSFGKFIDPIADKLLVNTLMILLAYNELLPIAPVLIMLWRDILVDGMRMMAAKSENVVAAKSSGKLKTVLQMLTITFALVSGMSLSFKGLEMISNILIYASLVVSIYSGVEYFKLCKKYIMESK